MGACTHSGTVFCQKENNNISRKLNRTRAHRVKGNKPDTEGQGPCVLPYVWNQEAHERTVSIVKVEEVTVTKGGTDIGAEEGEYGEHT